MCANTHEHSENNVDNELLKTRSKNKAKEINRRKVNDH